MPSPSTDHRRYAPIGLLAVAPEAHGLEFITGAPTSTPYTLTPDGSAAVVHVCGPIAFSGWLFDSYAAIVERAEAAFACESARAVILKLDSPGGDVAGAFDAARDLRRLADSAGKPLIAWTGSQAASAAYALASVADRIYASDSAVIGSIGVIFAIDISVAADALTGHSFEILTSGERKADGNTHAAMTDDARAAIQRRVDDTARVFFELVHTHRPQVDTKALQADSLVGASALAAGLIDEIASWATLTSSVGRIGAMLAVSRTAAKESATMPAPEPEKKDEEKKDEPEKDSVRAALAKAAGVAGPAGRKALKALQAYDKAEDEPDGDEAKAAAPAAPAAKTAADAAKAESDESDKKAAVALAATAATVQSLASEVAALKAERAKADLVTFKATRPDIKSETWTVLEAQGLSLSGLQAICATIPKAFSNTTHVDPVPNAARGSSTGAGDLTAGAMPPLTSLSAAFGRGQTAPTAVVFDPTTQVMSFGVPAPQQGAR